MYQGWKFYEMDVEVILHDSGELLPILLDELNSFLMILEPL